MDLHGDCPGLALVTAGIRNALAAVAVSVYSLNKDSFFNSTLISTSTDLEAE